MDIVDKKTRSRMMSNIKSKNTKPEITVRKLMFSMGFRYRLHNKDLPGKPDISIKKYKTAIFVNGCYWHRHEKCKLAYSPKSNVDFWNKKLNENVNRDKRNHKVLKELGWRVIVIWECQTKDLDYLKQIIVSLNIK